MVLKSTSLIAAHGKLFIVTSVCLYYVVQEISTDRIKEKAMSDQLSASHDKDIMQDQLCEYCSVKQII